MRRTLQNRLQRLEGRAPGQPIELDLPPDVAARATAAKEAGTFPEALADADLEAIVSAHDRVTYV